MLSGRWWLVLCFYKYVYVYISIYIGILEVGRDSFVLGLTFVYNC